MHTSPLVAHKLLVLLTDLYFTDGIVAEVEIIQILQVLLDQIVIEKVAHVQHTITVHALRKDP